MLKDQNKYSVLVIEDNEGDLALIEDYLMDKIAVPDIVRARNLREAKLALRDQGPSFQVVLLDLSLPDKSGEELLNEMNALCQDIPLIVLTGYSNTPFSIRALSIGASDYLVKDDLTAASLYKSIVYSIERKRITLELKDSEKRYSDLFHLSPQPMWVEDLKTLQFLNVNAAAVEGYGYSAEEFLSMSILDIISPEDITTVRETFCASGQSQGLYRHGIFGIRKQNGDIIKVDIQSNVISFRGKPARVVLSNDVTERISYIRAIEQQNKRLREIAWAQSHLVRAPLTRMMGVIELLRNFNHLDIDREQLMDSLMDSAVELDELIREISRKTERIEVNSDHES